MSRNETRKTLIDDWKFPVHPGTLCEHCCEWMPLAYFDTDGVCLCWEAVDDDGRPCAYGCMEHDPEIEWPFHDEYASPNDFRAIGFRVE